MFCFQLQYSIPRVDIILPTTSLHTLVCCVHSRRCVDVPPLNPLAPDFRYPKRLLQQLPALHCLSSARWQGHHCQHLRARKTSNGKWKIVFHLPGSCHPPGEEGRGAAPTRARSDGEPIKQSAQGACGAAPLPQVLGTIGRVLSRCRDWHYLAGLPLCASTFRSRGSRRGSHRGGYSTAAKTVVFTANQTKAKPPERPGTSGHRRWRPPPPLPLLRQKSGATVVPGRRELAGASSGLPDSS